MTPVCTVELGPGGRRIEVEEGEPLFDPIRAAGLPLASSCDREGICGKCALVVLVGADLLDPISAGEERVLRDNGVPPGRRLSCLARMVRTGRLVVDAPYWPRPPGVARP